MYCMRPMTQVTVPADSAQVPWAGRDLSPSGFETDTGAADPAVLAALATPGDDLALMRAVEAARFVVPIVSDLTEADTTGDLAVAAVTDAEEPATAR